MIDERGFERFPCTRGLLMRTSNTIKLMTPFGAVLLIISLAIPFTTAALNAIGDPGSR
jgi:hypothetical protein